MQTFEYQVCQVQQSRVTFVNGRWAGAVPQDQCDVQAAFASCPTVWDYMNQAGAEGWELVAVTSRPEPQGQALDVVYLQRQR